MKKRFIFCYDISDNRTLQKVAKELEKHGIRTQYSFFEIELSRSEADKLYKKLCQMVNKETDRVFMYLLPPDCKTIFLGKLSSLGVV